MKLQLIRNATMKIEYNGQSILTDPMLSTKFDIESFGGNSRNPTIDLPMSIEEILFGVDAVISSHTHQDHFDTAAMNIIPSDMTILCQPGDAEKFKNNKFSSVNPVHESTIFSEISIIRTMGHHGTGEIEKAMGKTSGK